MSDMVQQPNETSVPEALAKRVGKHQEVHRIAVEIFERTPEWTVFYREVLGVDGVVSQMFEGEEYEAFAQGETYAQIHQMLATLRRKRAKEDDKKDKKENAADAGTETDAVAEADIMAEIGAMAENASQNGNGQLPIQNSEPTKVITVRLPESLHAALRAEAYDKQTSMNQLCISKLVQIIDRKFVPSD